MSDADRVIATASDTLNFLVVFFLMLLPPQSVHAATPLTFDVLRYGAKADGVTNNRAAFLKAWKAVCAASQSATLYVPAASGDFLLYPTLFSGPCTNTKMVVEVNGNLVASPDYTLESKVGYWLKFDNVAGLTFQGGHLDGKGSALWACKAKKKASCPFGARSLMFTHSKDLTLSGITSVNSELFNVVIEHCSNVAADGLTIKSPATSPNTDGIHVEQSTDVTLTNTNIQTGDDCISIGPGTKNLWMEMVTCGPGHGISIGSLGKNSIETGVQNVTLKGSIFAGSTNGVRMKSWARNSNGFAKGIVFDGISMNNVRNPIIINQHYSDSQAGRWLTLNSVVKFSDITYSNIKGSSATQVGVSFACSATAPCDGIQMSNIQLTYNGHPATASCANAYGSASGVLLPPSCLKTSSSSGSLIFSLWDALSSTVDSFLAKYNQ